MESKMVPCPNCGAGNSPKKRICFNCQQELSGAEQSASAAHGAKQIPVPETGSLHASKTTALPANATAAPSIRTNTIAAWQNAVQHQRRKLADLTGTPSPGLQTRRPLLAASALFGATLRERVQFFRQLHSMLKAGIPLTQSLHFLQTNVSRIFRPVARDIAENVSQGIPLSSVMTRYANLFPDWEVNIVQAAELSGSLPEVIEEIAINQEAEMRLRSRVFSVMIPMIATVAFAILVGLILHGLANQHGSIPQIMHILVRAGLTFVVIVIVVILLIRLWRVAARTRIGAFVINSVITGIPLLGTIMRNMMRIRFARVLAALWDAGVSPMASVLSAARASGNLPAIYRARYEVPRLGEGATLVEVLEAVRMFPRDAMHIIRTGETSGSLPDSLRKVAEYYQIDLDAQMDTLPSKVIIWYYLIIVPIIGYFIFQFYTGYGKSLGDLMP